MKAISLNGRDGSGKSQQIRLLKWRNQNQLHITKPLGSYSTRWPKLTGYEASQWWFEIVPVDELTDIIIESLNVRQEDCLSDRFSVYDRGTRMFKAVCAATRMTRENVSLLAAIRITDRQFDGGLSHFTDEYEILFKIDPDYFSRVGKFVEVIRPREDIGFPDSARCRYRQYQSNLAAAMEVYFSQPVPFCIEVKESILSIQNRLREILNTACQIKLPQIRETPQLFVCLGGLSECGKSSFAEHLRINYQFCRLKLRYFIEIIEKRGDAVTPESICLELFDYLERHYFLARISIESLHDPFVPAILKLMLGEQVQIVYIEVDYSTRVRRAAKERNVGFEVADMIVTEKDRIKRDRGAERVRNIADIIFDNSSNVLQLNLKTFADRLIS